VPDQARIVDLLVQWEEGQQQGQDLTPEILCPDDPALQDMLRQRIERRRRMNAALEPTRADHRAAPSAPAMPRLDGFDLLEVIGHGGMGIVYKARHQELDRLVAIKMILAGPLAHGHELHRFRTEAHAVAQLAHPNIVQIHDVGGAEGHPFLVLEFVPGGSLASQLDGTPMAPQRAAGLVLTLARAVAFAHRQGIVHRDLKPANVLIGSDGAPKIADFGLAKRLGDDAGQTQTGTILGSPSYMAPEQAEGKTQLVGPAADIYALGAIFYELLTGRPPFKADSLLATLEQVRQHEAVAPRDLQPHLPRDLDTICLKCLEKKPDHRYASADALADDLQRFAQGEPIHARELGVVELMGRALSRNEFEARFGAFGIIMLTMAPICFLIPAITYGFFAHHPLFAQINVLVSLGMILILPAYFMIVSFPGLRYLSSRQRRRYWSVWLTHPVANTLIFLAVWFGVPHTEPMTLMVIYPLWAIMVGEIYLSHGSDVGIWYVIGGSFFAVAVLMLFVPYWCPLIAAVATGCNFLAQGTFLLRTGRNAGDVTPSPASE